MQSSTSAPSAEAFRLMRIQMARHDATEHRRRLMQGLGRPILSVEHQGYRLVAVSSQLHWSQNWRTFHDFLFAYIRRVFTPDWGNAELKKDLAERHPLLQWYQKLCEFQKLHAVQRNGIYTGEMTGSIKLYLELAYDLYLCAHNAKLVPLLVKRLKNPLTFEGALYETFVLGSFVKAGFGIEMEEEDDSTTAHCEFVATHRETGRKFSVEAKAVTSESKRAGITSEPPRIREKIYKALAKDLAHERIICVELSRAQTFSAENVPDWVPLVDADVVDAEKTLTISNAPAPPAYILVTNRTHLHNLDASAEPEVMFACGFKIDDFAPRVPLPLLTLVEARERHIELHWLMQAMEKHAQIPSTFDDKTPEEAFHGAELTSRLRIGEVHPFHDGRGKVITGVVVDAIVDTRQRKAIYAFDLTSGASVIVQQELGAADIAAYTASPDTYFDVVKPIRKPITKALDTFDFVYESCRNTPRERLLQLMSTWPDPVARENLSQEELARRYSVALAESFIMHMRKPQAPPTRNNISTVWETTARKPYRGSRDDTTMQRQMNADELEDFYQRVGAAIWHVQYLEDVLVSFLAMKIISPKRSAGQATAAEMDALLAQKRRLTLGPLIQACVGQNIITPALEPRFETFKTDRHWLVHRSLVESGDDLFNEAMREAVLRRIYSVQEEAISLKKLIAVDMEAWLAGQGLDVKRAAELGEAAYRKLAGR